MFVNYDINPSGLDHEYVCMHALISQGWVVYLFGSRSVGLGLAFCEIDVVVIHLCMGGLR